CKWISRRKERMAANRTDSSKKRRTKLGTVRLYSRAARTSSIFEEERESRSRDIEIRKTNHHRGQTYAVDSLPCPLQNRVDIGGSRATVQFVHQMSGGFSCCLGGTVLVIEQVMMVVVVGVMWRTVMDVHRQIHRHRNRGWTVGGGDITAARWWRD